MIFSRDSVIAKIVISTLTVAAVLFSSHSFSTQELLSHAKPVKLQIMANRLGEHLGDENMNPESDGHIRSSINASTKDKPQKLKRIKNKNAQGYEKKPLVFSNKNQPLVILTRQNTLSNLEFPIKPLVFTSRKATIKKSNYSKMKYEIKPLNYVNQHASVLTVNPFQNSAESPVKKPIDNLEKTIKPLPKMFLSDFVKLQDDTKDSFPRPREMFLKKQSDGESSSSLKDEISNIFSFKRRLPNIANDEMAESDMPRRVKALGPSSNVKRPRLSKFQNNKTSYKNRWRLVDKLGYHEQWYDPYNRNLLKADRPIFGSDWFFNVTAVSDTTYEKRHLPTPVGLQTSQNNNSNDVFGATKQDTLITNLAMEYVLYKGDTVFRPPDHEFRFIPVVNYNATRVEERAVVNVNPEEGVSRYKTDLAIQGLFYDKHLRNVSDRYDFDSIRIGIQPYTHDFRGFLFLDNPLGVRLFGTRNNNIFQYNLSYFRRLEKDVNSGLNDVSEGLRKEDIYTANLYAQDLFYKGFNTQASFAHVRNRENSAIRYDENGFIQRPASIGFERLREYDVSYIGLHGDGHIGTLNASVASYYSFGESRNGVFSDRQEKIRSHFVAAELSKDNDWWRPKFSFLHASGDKDPYDDTAGGFDAINENPQFAGADSSFWLRQSVPFIAGGQVGLSTRNGILNNLRSTKEQGQANFNNPGMQLVGLGIDADITAQTRLSAHINKLAFDSTQVLEVSRNQGSISKDIGMDLSVGAIYRPLASQNIVLRMSYAKLLAGKGYRDLFPDENPDSLFLNLILTY